MTYDPRDKSVNDALYPERSGKTVRVVATIAARDAIAAGDKYNGMLVQVLAAPRKMYSWDGDSWAEVSGVRSVADVTARDAIPADEKYDGLLVQTLDTRKLYSWDAAGAAWAVVAGGGGLAKFDNLAAIEAAPNATDGDFAVALDTNKLYQRIGGFWTEFSSGGGGSGIQKYANLAAIQAIPLPEECDFAVAQDTGIMMEYHDGVWVFANNSFTDVMASSNWVLVDKIIVAAGGTLDKTITDLDGDYDGQYLIRFGGVAAGIMFYAQFNGDTANNYYRCNDNSGSDITKSAVTISGAMFLGNINIGGSSGEATIASRSGKARVSYSQQNGVGATITTMYGQCYYSYWTNTTANITSMRLYTGGVLSGGCVVEVYKWATMSKPIDLATYELVKEYNLNNQILSDTIPWDGETDDTAFIVVQSSAVAGYIYISPNGDIATANFPYSQSYNSGTTPAAFTGTGPGFTVAPGGHGQITTTNIGLRVNGHKRSCTYVSGHSDSAQTTVSQWTNTTSKVTSLKVHTNGIATTSRIRIYKLAQAQLVSTNPNIITTAVKYVDANTVEVQPGEVEINGAVCKLSKPKQITLSGNLEAGITEVSGTRFYLYAIRGATGQTPSFVFSTVPPLMDRYGNAVASFVNCDLRKAWFHPNLGPMYRCVGYIDNDTASNISPFADRTLDAMSGGSGDILQGVPIGTVLANAGSVLPKGFLNCYGGTAKIADYPQLAAHLGNTYGVATATDFYLPDLRGYFIRGLDNGRGVDANRVLGSSQLDALQNMIGDVVIIKSMVLSATGAFSAWSTGAQPYCGTSASAGINQNVRFNASNVARTSTETRPVNVAMNYIICATLLTPGSGANSVVSKSVDYTATDKEKVIMIAPKTVTLTTAPNAQITVKSGAEGVVTVVPSSGTIDGQPLHRILNQYDSADYMCDGTNWWVI